MKNRPLNWIISNNRKYIWAVILFSLLSAIISGSFIVIALLSRQVLDIATGDTDGNLLKPAILIAIIIAVQAILNILYANLRIRIKTNIEMNIRSGMFNTLLSKQYSSIKQIHSGEILNLFTSDIDVVASGIISLVPRLVSMTTQLIGGLAALILVDAKFALTIILLGVVILLAGKIYSSKFRYLHKEIQRTNGIVKSFLQECIENVVVIKSFVNEHSMLKHLTEYQNDNFKIRKKQTAVSNFANTSLYVVFTGGYYLALVWGAVRIANGTMTFGSITALLQIFNQITDPITSMSGILPEYYSIIASAERLMEIDKLPDEERKTEITDVKEFYSSLKSIRLEQISFTYEDDELILDNAGLEIRKGTFLAVTGPSGEGKSTLIKLLLALNTPQKGRLYLQTDNKQIDIDAGTRVLFAYVPQGNLLLSGTIRDNLLFGNQEVTDEKIHEAADIACIAEDIEALPDSYDTVIGERGTGLSEGQGQRIAIARAILSEAPILLLDECTSALDGSTEARLLENLKRLKGRTIICISHKIATIESCDTQVVLDGHRFNKVK